MLTEENLSHWITSKAADEQIRIQNYEVQQDKYEHSVSVSDRNHFKHPVTNRGFKLPGTLKGFEKWYKGRLHSVHPLGPETMDKIAESNFN